MDLYIHIVKVITAMVQLTPLTNTNACTRYEHSKHSVKQQTEITQSQLSSFYALDQ